MGIEARTDETPDFALGILREHCPEAVVETLLPQGDPTAVIRPEHLLKVAGFLKTDPRLQFNVLIDITAVDYPERNPRFDLVYQLLSLPFNRRIRLKAPVGGAEPSVESITPLWGSANWLEREVWDMFGIRFNGHPDLKRILMYDGFEGHPLRKDYPINKRQPRIGPKI
ncbi:MAG: nuoC [Acidobacteria bacterium]|jgi:NADH-quinone oxidoreductase subunit C|nr:nuoC [Acidobacteriota bacterium]